MKNFNKKLIVVALAFFFVIGLVGPTTTFAASPVTVDLLSAVNFGVLAGSTITNTGATTINGDLGLSPGTSVTGSPIVVGVSYITDPTAAAAKLDLTTAYNDAAGRILSPITVSGNLGGQTLAPGLYKSTSSLEISSGDLTLDAGGDSDAVWIFQMASTLTTTSGRQVFLANGAQAGNVFWQVGSSATLGTTSVFKGTIMADQSITLVTGATVEGRLLARIGAVNLDTNTVTFPILTSSPDPVFIDADNDGVLDGGEQSFTMIQAAIDVASTIVPQTIVATAGPYTENITIDKSLTLKGVGDATHITGNINVTSDNVTIQSLKITNSNPHDSGVNDYGIKTTAGKTLTLETVTIDVLHNGVYMTGDSASATALTINHSTIKGYGAVYLNGTINIAGTPNNAVVTIHDTNLTGSTSYSGTSDDFSTLGLDYAQHVNVVFTGTSSVANEYTNSAKAKERLITFWDASNNTVTGTPTYTNGHSEINDDALFVSGGYDSGYSDTNTVAGKIVSRYVYDTITFEDAIASGAAIPIVVGRAETAIVTTTPGTQTLVAGAKLIIEAPDSTPVTISSGTTLIIDGTIILEAGATITNNGGTLSDLIIPVIKLLEDATVNLTVGDSYIEAGATALDNFDGDITSKIITTGTVDTTKAGTYTITYNVSDAAHNAAISVTRTVNVTAVVVAHNTSGSYLPGYGPNAIVNQIDEECKAGDLFSITTGKRCPVAETVAPVTVKKDVVVTTTPKTTEPETLPTINQLAQSTGKAAVESVQEIAPTSENVDGIVGNDLSASAVVANPGFFNSKLFKFLAGAAGIIIILLGINYFIPKKEITGPTGSKEL